MAPGGHRPGDADYWTDAWASILFSGDLFEAIPFGEQPIRLMTGEDESGAKHYLGDVAFGYGLLVSPTCDMVDQGSSPPRQAHPYRVLVPVLPLAAVVEGLVDSRGAWV